MKKIIALFAMVLFISISLINCSEDKVTNPGDNHNATVEYDLCTVPATIGYPMGWVGIDSNEEPVHTVSLDKFQIGKYEVPYALWTEVKTWAESNGYTFANAGQQGGCYPEPCTLTDQHPVTYINWRDCIAWCNAYSEKEGLTPVYYTSSSKTEIYRNSSTGGDIGNDFVDWAGDGFRLPTEAEWEYAARYINGTSVSSGAEHSGCNLDPDIEDCVWYEDNTGTSTHPVGQLHENSLGAYDMSGHVWEWCWDQFDNYPSSLQDNPLGPDVNVSEPYIYRVHRGGGWYNSSAYCRSATRDFGGRGSASEEIYTGFRVCRGGTN